MGARKRIRAEKLKEQKKNTCIAVLRNSPFSPRKTRLIANLIRGVEINRALDILKFTRKAPAESMEKLLLSAISNWQQKNEGKRIEDSNLFVKEIFVDQSKTLRRLRTAPQGRGHIIRKRSNHVTIILDSLDNMIEVVETVEEQNNN